MPDFTVIRHGTDTSSRPIFMTRYMQQWWRDCCDELGFTPTIVQGAHMKKAGGGAKDSAGYHDLGGCLDLRLWDRTAAERDKMMRTFRRRGAAYWERDQRHGMDLHAHLLLGSDRPLADGAATQWEQYKGGENGLSNRGRDYHWRPSPLVLVPPTGKPDPEPKPPAKPPVRTYFIDVHPRYQKGIDFRAAKAEGIAAAVIKCTEGNSVSYGADYTRMVNDAKDAGLMLAVYHYLHSTSTVASQAAHLAKNIGDKNLPVMVDCERGSQPRISHVKGFIKECAKLGLKVTMLYLPRWYWSGDMRKPKLEIPELADIALWNSAYGANHALPPAQAYEANKTDGRWSKMGGKGVRFLQFGDNVVVAGMQLDGNVYLGGAKRLEKWFAPAVVVEPKPDPEPQPKPVIDELVAVTYNFGPKGTTATKAADLKRLMRGGPHVIGTQESGDQDPAFKNTPGFVVHREKGDHRAKVALLIRDDVPIVDKGYHKCTEQTYVGRPPGAKLPKVCEPKWIAWATLDLGDRQQTIGVTHMIPGVTRKMPTPSRKRRRAVFARHVAAMLDWFAEHPGGVILLDANSGADYFQWEVLRQAGLTLSFATSHGKRAIDGAIGRPGKAKALPKMSSDHAPVEVRFER